MINDTSQGSVATWFRRGGTFDYYFDKFTDESASNRLLKSVKIWGNYG